MEVALERVNVKVILSFLECLVSNDCVYSLLTIYLSAIKASFVLYDLKLYQRSVRINRPLTLVSHNIIDLPILGV